MSTTDSTHSSKTNSRFCRFIMSSIILLFSLSALDLAGVFFNIRMLLTCFKDKKTCTHLHKFRPLVFCQFVYQVTILATTTIEAWRGLDGSHKETQCHVVQLLSMSTVVIFLVYNSMAISVMVAQYHPDMPDKSQQLSPKLSLLAALFSGFISSALIWSKCYTSLSEFVPKMVIFVIFFAPAVLFLFVASKKYAQIFNKSNEKLKLASALWNTVKESKRNAFLAAWLFMYGGVTIALQSLPQSLYEDLIKKQAVFYLNQLVKNVVAGIVFPLAFRELISLTCV